MSTTQDNQIISKRVNTQSNNRLKTLSPNFSFYNYRLNIPQQIQQLHLCATYNYPTNAQKELFNNVFY